MYWICGNAIVLGVVTCPIRLLLALAFDVHTKNNDH